MEYEVKIYSSALRNLDRLPKKVKISIRHKIRALAVNPYPYNATALKGIGYYKIRVGDYRILYEVNDEVREVEIHRIRHRKEAYRNL